MSAGGSSRTASVSSWRYRCERRLQPAAATSTNDATAAAAAAGLRAVPAAVTAVADVAVVGNATALGQLFVGQTRCGTRRLWPFSPAAIIIIIAAAAQSSPSSSAGWSGDRRFATLPVGRWFGLRSRRIHVGSTRIETRPGNQTHSIPFHHHLLFFFFFSSPFLRNVRSWPTEFVFLPVLPLEAILREFDHALDRICRLNLMIFFTPLFFPCRSNV